MIAEHFILKAVIIILDMEVFIFAHTIGLNFNFIVTILQILFITYYYLDERIMKQ